MSRDCCDKKEIAIRASCFILLMSCALAPVFVPATGTISSSCTLSIYNVPPVNCDALIGIKVSNASTWPAGLTTLVNNLILPFIMKNATQALLTLSDACASFPPRSQYSAWSFYGKNVFDGSNFFDAGRCSVSVDYNLNPFLLILGTVTLCAFALIGCCGGLMLCCGGLMLLSRFWQSQENVPDQVPPPVVISDSNSENGPPTERHMLSHSSQSFEAFVV